MFDFLNPEKRIKPRIHFTPDFFSPRAWSFTPGNYAPWNRKAEGFVERMNRERSGRIRLANIRLWSEMPAYGMGAPSSAPAPLRTCAGYDSGGISTTMIFGSASAGIF